MDVKAVNRRVIEQYRAGGEVEGMHRERLLLLTTTGRRSGAARTAPMMFAATGDGPLVVASNMGAAQHPDWFENLAADPRVVVETPDGERWPALAEPLSGPQRQRWWERLAAEFPFLEDHRRSAGDREIPLVVLRRDPDREPDAGAA